MLAYLPRGLAVVVVTLPWGFSWLTSDRLADHELVVAKAMALARIWACGGMAAAVRESEVARALELLR